MTLLAMPAWIDAEAWTGFVQMRKQIKAPLTDRATILILKELSKIRAAGHDANASLDQSTMHCWRDVYPPKDKRIEKAATSAADETQEYLRRLEAEALRAAPPPADLKARIRRVA